MNRITATSPGRYSVRVEGGSCTGTYAECAEFLRYAGLTAEQQVAEATFEGGGMGTGF